MITVEDTDVTLDDIQREFGSEIAKIVDGPYQDKHRYYHQHHTAGGELLKNIANALLTTPV